MPAQDVCRENSHGEAAAAQLNDWLTDCPTHTRTCTHIHILSNIHRCSPAAFHCPHPLVHAQPFSVSHSSPLLCLFLVKSLLSTASNHSQNKDCGSNIIDENKKQQMSVRDRTDKCTVDLKSRCLFLCLHFIPRYPSAASILQRALCGKTSKSTAGECSQSYRSNRILA